MVQAIQDQWAIVVAVIVVVTLVGWFLTNGTMRR